MKKSYQPDVNFSSFQDVKAIAQTYEKSVFGKKNGVSGNIRNYRKLKSSFNWRGENADRFEAVLNRIEQVENLRNEKVSGEHPEAYENIMVAYADLCGACKEYIDNTEYGHSLSGRRRVSIVKKIFTTAEKEVLMLQMRYFEMGSQFKGEGITLRQLFAGETLPQLIQDDAANFSLEESNAAPVAEAEGYRLHISAGEFKNRISAEALVDAKDSSVIAILLEYYQRILSRMDTDPASKRLIPEVLHRIQILCGQNGESTVLAELSQDAQRIFDETRADQLQTVSTAGLIGRDGFVPYRRYRDTADLTMEEEQVSSDLFSDYPVISEREATEMSGENEYNRGEAATTLYGLASKQGREHGYIQTSNSFRINQYLRNQKFEDVSYKSHRTIGLLNEATKQNRLPHKARFYRLLGPQYLQYALGLGQYADATSFAPGTVQAINAMAGKVITDTGFMCVGYQVDMIFGRYPVMLTLLCDKDMPLMATTNLTEGEFIFPRNTSYMIIGARKREGKEDRGRSMIGVEFNGTRDRGVFNGLEIICKVLNPGSFQNQDANARP